MLEAGGRYGGLDTVLVVEEDARVIGACKLYRLTQHITGRPLAMMGLAAVAVDPAWRRRGVGAGLCAEAARTGRKRGDAISVLYPFRPDYYARLGWGLVGRLLDYRFSTDALPLYPESANVRLARSERDVRALTQSYARVVARSHGPIERDAGVWAYRLVGEELAVRALDADAVRRTLSDPSRLILVHDRNGVDGYALLRSRAVGAAHADLAVRELVTETEPALRGLLGWIASKAERWPNARYRARPEQMFEDRLREPRPPNHRSGSSLYFHTGRVTRGPMLRVLDAPRAFRARAWFDGVRTAPAGGVMDVEVSDVLIPENRGPWRIRFGDDGEASVAPTGADPGAASVTVKTDPSTLARLYAGDLDVTGAVRLGVCEAEGDLAMADAAFSVRETFWLPDEF